MFSPLVSTWLDCMHVHTHLKQRWHWYEREREREHEISENLEKISRENWWFHDMKCLNAWFAMKLGDFFSSLLLLLPKKIQKKKSPTYWSLIITPQAFSFGNKAIGKAPCRSWFVTLWFGIDTIYMKKGALFSLSFSCSQCREFCNCSTPWAIASEGWQWLRSLHILDTSWHVCAQKCYWLTSREKRVWGGALFKSGLESWNHCNTGSGRKSTDWSFFPSTFLAHSNFLRQFAVSRVSTYARASQSGLPNQCIYLSNCTAPKATLFECLISGHQW